MSDLNALFQKIKQRDPNQAPSIKRLKKCSVALPFLS